MTLKRSLKLLSLLFLPSFLAMASSATARTVTWSGYTWDVRPGGTAQEPGPNDWSDSTANVQLSGSTLLLSIVKNSSGHWTSAEIDNQQHLGYGTYRWVVASDLSSLDANEVLGMFTYDDGGTSPSNNEIDIEPSHWGNLSWPTGSATVWQNANANLSTERGFAYSNRPPYVNQFTWSPGKITYLVSDATGATLLSWTLTNGVPTPATEVPVINYWRFENVPPTRVRTIDISSFSWAPLGQQLPPVGGVGGTGQGGGGTGGGTGGGAGSGGGTVGRPGSSQTPGPSQGTTTGSTQKAGTSRLGGAWTCDVGDGAGATRPVQVRMSLLPRRFAVAGRHRGGVIRWTATGTARLQLILTRRIHRRFVVVGSLRRSVHAGSGLVRLPPVRGHRSMRPGVYGLSLRTGASHVRCTGTRIRFTVLRGTS